jgi:hypothetical protein
MTPPTSLKDGEEDDDEKSAMTAHRWKHLVKGTEEEEDRESASPYRKKDPRKCPRKIRNMRPRPRTERDEGLITQDQGPLTDNYMLVLMPLMHTPVGVRSLSHKSLWRPIIYYSLLATCISLDDFPSAESF